VAALLTLSQALAHATTSDDVATRLAENAPEVLGCDHVGVYVWDDGTHCLRPAGARGAIADSIGYGLGHAESPFVEQLLAAGTAPHYFSADTEDPALAEIMAEHGLCAIALAPVVTRDTFLGALVVGVRDEPRRLAQSPEAIERLVGVAALAAPPLQNGRLIEKLRYQAAHDPLTGLPNRAGFAERIGRAFDAARTGPATVGLLFIDLDGFKQVNDVHGHFAGDEILRQAADRLAHVVRSRDATARLGGDEFAVILTDVESEPELDAAACRLREAFVEPFDVHGTALSVRASVGGAIWPDDGTGIEALIRRADVAMYREKHQGATPAAH
jgi:diguanylate cyclase (GGDEF)-like protein